jgi:hypothetical protein
MAIAARMPMMIITTRSSISVKPLSFSSIDVRVRASIEVLSFSWVCGTAWSARGDVYEVSACPRAP